MFLPFRNVTRASAQEWLVTGGSLMLQEALGQYRDLVVVRDDQLTAARRRLRIATDSVPDATQLRRLAEETDGWTAIVGNVIATGSGLRVSVQAVDAATGKVLTRAEAEIASDSGVPSAFRNLATQLLSAAGGVSATRDGAAGTTTSVAAYRAYAEGIQYMQVSAFRRAQQKFQEAVRLDSAFALAWSRLALAGIGWDIEALLNPLSLTFRAIEQAARHADRLPQRQAMTIRGWQAFYRGDLKRARFIADSLVVSSRDDLDSRELLVLLEMLDPTMAPGSPPRLEASWNRLVALARELLERDPGRRYVYGTLAYAYATAGGLWGGAVGGTRSESGTIAAKLSRSSDASFIPVLTDSFSFVPRQEFDRLSPADRARLVRRSADATKDWTDRWLGASPTDADAHVWASRAAELRGDDLAALREVLAADSLGVEVSLENVTGRRLSLFVRTGDYVRAGALADSLLSAGLLSARPFRAVLDRRRPNAVAALILSKRWDRMAALGLAIGGQTGATPSCSSLGAELVNAPRSSVPASVLRAIQDTVALHFGAASAEPSIARCAEGLAGLVFDSLTVRRRSIAEALLRVADSLQGAGNAPAAYRAARAAWDADTARRALVLQREWFRDRSLELAIGRHFAPPTATVGGDSLVVAFTRATAEPIVVDSRGLATNWSIRTVSRVTTASDSVAFITVLSHASGPIEAGVSGGTAEMLAMPTRLIAQHVRPASAAPESSSTAAATSDGFVIVVRGPFVSEMNRLRPTTMQVFAFPCIGTAAGLCGRVVAPITYR